MKSILYICIAAILLASGFYLHSVGSAVSGADRQRCEAIIAAMYGDDDSGQSLAEQCNQPGMVAMMDARAQNLDAEETAQAISKANGNLIGTYLPYALIGGGIGALGAAFTARRKRTV